LGFPPTSFGGLARCNGRALFRIFTRHAERAGDKRRLLHPPLVVWHDVTIVPFLEFLLVMLKERAIKRRLLHPPLVVWHDVTVVPFLEFFTRHAERAGDKQQLLYFS